jgi:hypothetical protein
MELIDTTIRPLCFDIPNNITKETASKVGSTKFKRYEHVLYVCAQLVRIVYYDTGIIWKTIETCFGLSNDIVSNVVNTYNTKYEHLRRIPIESQNGNGSGLPMESFSIKKAAASDKKYGTYISTPGDLTCLFLSAHKLKENPNSIFKKNDLFIAFKGSSTVSNFKDDFLSQFIFTNLSTAVAPIGIKVPEGKLRVPKSFIQPIIKGWSALEKALEEHVTDECRIFLCGHSLGGAFCSLFGFLLAEGKVSGTIPILARVKSIHIISYGAPTILGDKARNRFNEHLDSGILTLDRVVSQRFPTHVTSKQIVLGGIMGPNDIVPLIPIGFSHPGFRPLISERHADREGRPFSIDHIRTLYGVETNTRSRDPRTWPFSESIDLWDTKNKEKLDAIINDLTSLHLVEDEPIQEIPELEHISIPHQVNQVGGGIYSKDKYIYEVATKYHIPNFVSIKGHRRAYLFAHLEYLGMFFGNTFRTKKLKHPANKLTAYFEICRSGIKINYVPFNTTPSSKNNTRRKERYSRHKTRRH